MVLLHIVETEESRLFRRMVVVWNVLGAILVTDADVETPACAYEVALVKAMGLPGSEVEVLDALSRFVVRRPVEEPLSGVWRLRDGEVDAIAIATPT